MSVRLNSFKRLANKPEGYRLMRRILDNFRFVDREMQPSQSKNEIKPNQCLPEKTAGDLILERRNRFNRPRAVRARDAPGQQSETQDSN
jgi:hypothetical protein